MSLDFVQRQVLFGILLGSFIIGIYVCGIIGISFVWLLAIIPIDALIIRWLVKRWKHPHGTPNPDTLDPNGHPICWCPLREGHNHKHPRA